MNALAKRSPLILILTGVIAVVFGIIAISRPGLSAITLVVVWGFYAIADGVVALISAFRDGASGGMRIFTIVVGVIGVLAGIIAVARPFSSTVALAWALGFWLVFRGLFELASAFTTRRDGSRWLLVLSGLLFVVAGVIFMANPGEAALSVAVMLGIIAVAWGLALVVAGFVVRSKIKSGEIAV